MAYVVVALVLTWAALLLVGAIALTALREAKAVRGARTLTSEFGPGIRAPVVGSTYEPGRHTLLLFLGEHCPTCAAVAPFLRDRLTALPAGPDVRFVTTSADDVPAPIAGLAHEVVADDRSFVALGIKATPSAVVVGPAGAVVLAAQLGNEHIIDRFFHDLGHLASPVGATP